MKELSVTERNKIGLYIAKLISADKEKAIKDVSIEEAGIDDIIKIAYGGFQK